MASLGIDDILTDLVVGMEVVEKMLIAADVCTEDDIRTARLAAKASWQQSEARFAETNRPQSSSQRLRAIERILRSTTPERRLKILRKAMERAYEG